MSWQQYVDDTLIGSGKVAKAAILGHDGSIWASTPDFKIPPAEGQKLEQAFTSTDDIAANGLYLLSKKYIYLRKPQENVIYAREGSNGVVCYKSSQCVIIGYYDEHHSAGNCNQIVENLGDYLLAQGF
ncbi:hypothetical protein BGZ65_006573 [Modicella reniformis]|uniref:Profilin n=1 Tax=Modicella reniformis TaxID=1440133 RepID=A0A9P6IJR3_9FUNG|nr:hypothetical protein BGZ65_006573 [Modicella reniformis]